MQYWLIVTSSANFKHDRDVLHFKFQGLSHRFRKQVQRMQPGDRVVYYVMGIHKFGATATVTGDYYEDASRLWTDKEETWPSRRPSKSDLMLADDELIDAKKLVGDLSFVKNKRNWGIFFQGSIKTIPEDDFKLIESEVKRIVAERPSRPEVPETPGVEPKTEAEFEQAVMALSLQTKSLHDRVAEMLEQVGTWMGYNTQTRHKITPDHAYELDVAWLTGRNPEIAVEVQISGNLTEAKDRLAHARKFNYRKVVLVLRTKDLERLNRLMKHEPELRSWMEAWSIGAVYRMYTAGEKFFGYFRQLKEAVYKDKKQLEMVK